MTKTECINIFNAMIHGTHISLQEKLLPMVSEFLLEKNVENPNKIISILAQNPSLVSRAFPEIIDFYCRKYEILTLNNVINGQLNPIMYYE